MLREQYLGSVRITSIDYDLLIETLKKITKDIKSKNTQVTRVLLYGSFALGNYNPESDVDLLIIVDKTETPFLLRSDGFIDFFRCIPFDVNILVYTEEEISAMIEKGNEFIISAMRNVREL